MPPIGVAFASVGLFLGRLVLQQETMIGREDKRVDAHSLEVCPGRLDLLQPGLEGGEPDVSLTRVVDLPAVDDNEVGIATALLQAGSRPGANVVETHATGLSTPGPPLIDTPVTNSTHALVGFAHRVLASSKAPEPRVSCQYKPSGFHDGSQGIHAHRLDDKYTTVNLARLF